jgi:cell division protein FtsB
MATFFTLKRLLVVGLIAGIAIGYVGPLRGYLAQRDTLATEQAELAALEMKRDRLTRCLEALKDPVVLEMVAREFGLGRPGEKVFNIPGLKRASSAGCAGEQPSG